MDLMLFKPTEMFVVVFVYAKHFYKYFVNFLSNIVNWNANVQNFYKYFVNHYHFRICSPQNRMLIYKYFVNIYQPLFGNGPDFEFAKIL